MFLIVIRQMSLPMAEGLGPNDPEGPFQPLIFHHHCPGEQYVFCNGCTVKTSQTVAAFCFYLA